MKQYTLIWITDDKYKLVGTRVFTRIQSLRDYKNYYLPEFKDDDLQQVDKDGYVWFVERRED